MSSAVQFKQQNPVNPCAELPEFYVDNKAILVEDQLYLIGGMTLDGASNKVYRATVREDGSLSEWVLDSLLPEAIAYQGVIEIKGKLYSIGGFNGERDSDRAYVADIHEDGSLGEWKLHIHLPEPVSLMGVCEVRNNLYILGGYSSRPSNKRRRGHKDKIYKFSIDEKGNLLGWGLCSELPKPLSQPKVIVKDDDIYLLGGINRSGFSKEVYRATVKEDGGLTYWVLCSSLPNHVVYFKPIVVDEKFHVLTTHSDYSFETGIYTTEIGKNRCTGDWSLVQKNFLPKSTSKFEVIDIGDSVYILGGCTMNGFSKDVYRIYL